MLISSAEIGNQVGVRPVVGSESSSANSSGSLSQGMSNNNSNHTETDNSSASLSTAGAVAAVSSELLDGSSVRLFRQNGTIFSPKLYTSGLQGGSVSRIKTFNTTGVASKLKISGAALGVYNMYNTYESYSTGHRSGIGASVDATFGAVGFAGWPGAVISTSYELGKSFGPSTWYGNNDYKWFE
jgi:hypothetical protein